MARMMKMVYSMVKGYPALSSVKHRPTGSRPLWQATAARDRVASVDQASATGTA